MAAQRLPPVRRTPLITRGKFLTKMKKKVAMALVQHIPDGATLFIDIGTTPEAIARALMVNHHQLRVVTNNLNVATMLMSKPDFSIILAGEKSVIKTAA